MVLLPSTRFNVAEYGSIALIEQLFCGQNLLRNALKSFHAIALPNTAISDCVYLLMVIGSRIFRRSSGSLKSVWLLEDAQSKDDLRLLPSNHFEALKGDRNGQFSI